MITGAPTAGRITSGLVARLRDDTARTLAAVQAGLEGLGAVTTGPVSGDRLPLVTESEDGEAARDLFRRISDLAGIVQLDVLFVGHPDAAPSGTAATPSATAATASPAAGTPGPTTKIHAGAHGAERDAHPARSRDPSRVEDQEVHP